MPVQHAWRSVSWPCCSFGKRCGGTVATAFGRGHGASARQREHWGIRTPFPSQWCRLRTWIGSCQPAKLAGMPTTIHESTRLPGGHDAEAPTNEPDLTSDAPEGEPAQRHAAPFTLAHIGRSASRRRRRAEQLAAAANGDRGQLEDQRAGFLRRLHRTSSDFDAIEGLRTVEQALSMAPRPKGLWAWERRERAPRQRWWHRLRRA